MATSLIKPEDQEALPSYVQSIQSSAEMPCHHHLCPNGRIWQKVD